MRGRELTICEFNVENLFVSMAYHAGEDLREISELAWKEMALAQLRKKQKPLRKLWGLAEAIRDIDPDVLMLAEVGGEESLADFNRWFLADLYEPFFVSGNASRGIDLGFLVRRGLPLRAEAYSNRETPVEVTGWEGKLAARFARDVAELRLYDGTELCLALLLVHLKSKITADKDHSGKDLRTGEAFALADLYARRRAEFPAAPVIVGGDLNADLGSLELEVLRRTDLTDFHDLLGTPEEARTSLTYFDHAGRPRRQIIDYLLLSPQLRDRVLTDRSYTYRYKGFYGIPDELPQSPAERYRMPSDHYPLVVTVRI